METVSKKVSGSHQHHYNHRHSHNRENNLRNKKGSPKESRKRCNTTTVLLSLLVIFIGIIAVTGLMVSTMVWLENKGGGDHGVSTTEIPRKTNEPQKPPKPHAPEFCLERRTTAHCSTDPCSQKYRTYDGTCNNQRNPLWGASETPFGRLLDPIYEDGVNTPVGWDPNMLYHGYLKPSARRVSQEVVTTQDTFPHQRFTDLVMVWGQYFDHDTDFTPKTNSLCTEKCVQKAPYCFPSFPPPNDERLERGECIPLTRSTRVCDLKPREQINTITSYIDASLVYGSTAKRAHDLRDFTNDYGHLREGISVLNEDGKLSKGLLPFVFEHPQDCMRPLDDNTGIPCFFTGDVRSNEHIGLIALHTVWVHEHNRIADELREINPHWNGETLFQETRKIIGALHQVISVDHWLPKIVGTKGMDLLGRYVGYNPYTNASTVNQFATASFRFGHAQISPEVKRLGPDFQEAYFGNLILHEAAFCPNRIVQEGGIDPVLRGMFGTSLKNIDSTHLLTDEVTENLFKLFSPKVPFDLATLNIQRGRDHGLPGYNQWRKFCDLPEANNFDDLAGEISNPIVRQKLQDLYGHPDNIDLFVAGLVEDPWYDSTLGPTFTCLIVHQFNAWREGDRYWYENHGVFTPLQIIQLERHSLGRVFCDSGDDIQHVQSDVFKRADWPGGYKTCDEILGMDLEAWRDTTGNGNVCT